MQIIRKISQAQKAILKLKQSGKSVGFVPTMGALHSGHLSLISRAREENDIVVVSIFVNPAQFGPNEDYLRYPRPFNKDSKLCRQHGVDIIFAPSVKEMYPDGYPAYVNIEKMPDILCGRFRPGHFRSVATIVTKLFNIVMPDNAYFGEKDFQQLKIITKMVSGLNFNINIVPCKTVREQSGLAKSSRNRYLSGIESANASKIHGILQQIRGYVNNSHNKYIDINAMLNKYKLKLKLIPDSKLEYLDICNSNTLEVVTGRIRISKTVPLRVLVAIKIGKTRLIDNIGI